jgi:hypothetical protein
VQVSSDKPYATTLSPPIPTKVTLEPTQKVGSVSPRPAGTLPPKINIKFSKKDLEDIVADHFQLDADPRSEAERDLEEYCRSIGSGHHSELVWTTCGGCEREFLAGNDYICRECRASI